LKTKCYCVFCINHPLHNKQKEFKEVLTGYYPEVGFIGSEFNEQGKEVNCLKPISDAFYDLGREPEDFEWKVTAYGDGCAITGVEVPGFTIFAYCGNEEDKEF
jgi:hypothetical protein